MDTGIPLELRAQKPCAWRRGRDRLFLAVIPDANAAVEINGLAAGLKHARKFAGRLIRTEHLHVSLFHLGSWDGLPGHIVARTRDAAARVQMPPFAVTFDRTASFWGRVGNHPFVLLGGDGVAGLRALFGTLGAALGRTGADLRMPSQYTPHVTLLYDARFADETPIAPISWTVREVVLVHSLYGQTRHSHLARWPLRPP